MSLGNVQDVHLDEAVCGECVVSLGGKEDLLADAAAAAAGVVTHAALIVVVQVHFPYLQGHQIVNENVSGNAHESGEV